MRENKAILFGRMLIRMTARRKAEAFIAKQGLVHANDAVLRHGVERGTHKDAEPKTLSDFFYLLSKELDEDDM